MNIAALLPFSIFLPLFVALLLLLVPFKLAATRVLTLGTTACILAACVYLACYLPFQAHASSWEDHLSLAFSFPDSLGLLAHLKLYLTPLSLPFFCLTALVGFLACWQGLTTEVAKPRLYAALLLLFQSGLYGSFASWNLFFFYFFHEFSLLATFVLLLLYGRSSRAAVALEMFLYLSLGGLLTLLGIFLLWHLGSEGMPLSFSLLEILRVAESGGFKAHLLSPTFGVLLFGLGILVSLFPLHAWATRTYAVAPTSLAMLHVAALKSLGFYAILQIILPIIDVSWGGWRSVFICLALGNAVVLTSVALASENLRRLVALNAIAHSGYVFLGLLTNCLLGMQAAVLLMLSHGLSTAALLALSTAVERRACTSDLKQMGGLAASSPRLAALFIATSMASIGLPGFANFWGELGVLAALYQEIPWVVPFALLGLLISALYFSRALGDIFYGPAKAALKERQASGLASDIGFQEAFPPCLILLTLLLLGLFPQWLLDPLSAYLKLLLAGM